MKMSIGGMNMTTPVNNDVNSNNVVPSTSASDAVNPATSSSSSASNTSSSSPLLYAGGLNVSTSSTLLEEQIIQANAQNLQLLADQVTKASTKDSNVPTTPTSLASQLRAVRSVDKLV